MKKTTARYIRIKSLKVSDKEKVLKAGKEVTLPAVEQRLQDNKFPFRNNASEKTMDQPLKCTGGKNCQLKTLNPAKMSLKKQKETDFFLDIQNLKGFIPSRHAL